MTVEEEIKISRRIEACLARAKSTTFDGEREVCLRKVEELKKILYKADASILENKQTVRIESTAFDIDSLRKIFVRSFFPYFADDFEPHIEQIPFSLFLYTTSFIEEELVKAGYKDYAESIAEYAKNLKKNPIYSLEAARWYFFILLDVELIKIIMKDSYVRGAYSSENDSLFGNTLNPMSASLRFYREKKQDFLERLNQGIFDDLVINLCNPKYLMAPTNA